MTDIRLAVVGTGAIAQMAHLPVLRKMRGVSIVALCDNDRAKARALADRLERSAGATGRYSKELVGRLAAQLFAVSNGIDDVLTDAPVEVVLGVQSILDRAQDATFSVGGVPRLRNVI